ncbi:MAG: hypothetical protein KatS3mg094_100 [Candidatus Parcubacteria bacterium]|nr:MAG: hypothetical protein KatS3mg094_100 [Candidatus Parcubacteria bacterium]
MIKEFKRDQHKNQTLFERFFEYRQQIKNLFFLLKRILTIPIIYYDYPSEKIKNSLQRIIDNLEKKYPGDQCRKYLTYLLLKENIIGERGIVPKKSEIEKFDFKGEDSIIYQLQLFIKNWQKENEEIIKLRKEKNFKSYLELLKLTENNLKNKKILDIGTGENYFIDYLYDKELTSGSYGLDIKPPILNEGHFFIGKLEELSFQSESFDLVTCVSSYPGIFVFELIESEEVNELNEEKIRELIRQGLEEMLRVTKKGGEIRITPFAKEIIFDEEKIKKYKKIYERLIKQKKLNEIIIEEIENYCKETQAKLEMEFLKKEKCPIYINKDNQPFKTKNYYIANNYVIIIKK